MINIMLIIMVICFLLSFTNFSRLNLSVFPFILASSIVLSKSILKEQVLIFGSSSIGVNTLCVLNCS